MAAPFKQPPYQEFAVCAFITAHPDNLERAEAEIFSKFIKEQLPQFTSANGFTTIIREGPSEKPSIKVYDTTPAEDKPAAEPEQEQEPLPQPPRTVFDFTVEDLVQEYYLWKSVNQITVYKYIEEKYAHIPHRRVMKIFGAYPNKKKADKAASRLQAQDPSLNYYVCPMGVFIPTDPLSIQCKENHNANKELAELLEDYEENQRESRDIMEKSKNQNLHNLAINSKQYIKQIGSRGLPDAAKLN